MSGTPKQKIGNKPPFPKTFIAWYKNFLLILDTVGPELDCRSVDEIEIGLTGKTTVNYHVEININDVSSDVTVTYITNPATQDFTKQDIGSQVSIILIVTNAAGKESTCTLYFKLRGNHANAFGTF